jgi:predicted SPOUT superfamily RNA methylase MTH1
MMKRKHQEDGGNASNHRRQKNTNRNRPHPKSQQDNNGTHRFGRVMHQPPKLKLQPRSASSSSTAATVYPTVSIAIPGSVVSNAQTRELQTQLAGQIARAAAVYRVDEIVVFDDGLGSTLKTVSNYRRGPNPRKKEQDEHKHETSSPGKQERQSSQEQPSTDPHAFLARILQYCECPQYLRRNFFPMHPDLQFAGLLPPLDAPHHLRRHDVSVYREGVVLERKDNNGKNDGGADASLVDCGIPNTLVQ